MLHWDYVLLGLISLIGLSEIVYVWREVALKKAEPLPPAPAPDLTAIQQELREHKAAINTLVVKSSRSK